MVASARPSGSWPGGSGRPRRPDRFRARHGTRANAASAGRYGLSILGLLSWRTVGRGNFRNAVRRASIPSTARSRAGGSPSRPKPRMGCRREPPPISRRCARRLPRWPARSGWASCSTSVRRPTNPRMSIRRHPSCPAVFMCTRATVAPQYSKRPRKYASGPLAPTRAWCVASTDIRSQNAHLR